MALTAQARCRPIAHAHDRTRYRVTAARHVPASRGYRLAARAAAGDTLDPVAVVKDCIAKTNAHPAPELLSAMLALEKSKAKADGWQEILTDPKTSWRLIFTADSKDVAAAQKKQPNKGGIYFPIPACQKFSGSLFENGVFLGPIGYLTFDGPFAMSGRQLTFDVVKMNIGLGPWKFSIPLKKDVKEINDMEDKSRKALPFFLYAYIDKDVVVGRGRGGGLAVWARADAEWTLKTGVARVYKS